VERCPSNAPDRGGDVPDQQPASDHGRSAPHFVSGRPTDLIALAITVAAAIRLSMLGTVVIGIASAERLRHFIG
jgi:hypothetical protein